MERLTSSKPLTESESMNLSLTDLYMRLKVYEDAEEQGRLIVLPCAVGDMLYAVTRNVISKFSVEHFEIYDSGVWVSWKVIDGFYGHFRMDGFPASSIGKTVFLSREEAEKALEGMK